jgi:hypothetical protein
VSVFIQKTAVDLVWSVRRRVRDPGRERMRKLAPFARAQSAAGFPQRGVAARTQQGWYIRILHWKA